jgi:hypothetical protein
MMTCIRKDCNMDLLIFTYDALVEQIAAHLPTFTESRLDLYLEYYRTFFYEGETSERLKPVAWQSP